MQSPNLPTPGTSWPIGHVGYLALLGRPNAGKSTLLNTILDYRLAAVSSKPQTTRKNWLGIHSDAESQILFVDTPGIHEPRHALGEAMRHSIAQAISDANLLLCLVDPTRPQGEEDLMVASTAANSQKPVLIAINKIDQADREQIEAARAFYCKHLPEATVFEISALNRKSTDPLLQEIKNRLPQGPFLFPPENITDAFERQIAAEIIREVLLENLQEEVPHATAVTIESWEETAKGCKIGAVLYVERLQQKMIVIGQKGQMIARLRHLAEKQLQGLHDGRVTLRLWVKIAPNWRKKDGAVRDFLG
jgi:GTP-binding protein Era